MTDMAPSLMNDRPTMAAARNGKNMGWLLGWIGLRMRLVFLIRWLNSRSASRMEFAGWLLALEVAGAEMQNAPPIC
jgi:hypothetical protein